MPTTTSTGPPRSPASATRRAPACTLVTSNIPTPYTRCRHTNSTGPATARVRASSAVAARTASLISQVRGPRMTGHSAGSTQCTGHSQSANDT